MALELQDLGSIKVHQEVHALLKAYASVHKQEMNSLVREIVHTWAQKQFDVMSMATSLAKAKDLPGITGEWQ